MPSVEIKTNWITLVIFFAGVIFLLWFFSREKPKAIDQVKIEQTYDSGRVVNLTINLNTPQTKIEFPPADKPQPSLDSAQLAAIMREIILGASVIDSTTVRDSSIEATIKTIIERNRLKSATLSYRWLKPISTVITLLPAKEKFKLYAGAFGYVPETGRSAFGPSLTATFPSQNINATIGRDISTRSWLFGIQKKISFKK